MPISQDELFARYKQLADRLERHLREINDTGTERRIKKLSEVQFKALCDNANSDPVIRDWLYCIEHGYPGRRLRRDAA